MSIYKVGKTPLVWKQNESQTVTFIVTEDCNLRCKYCYITHKAANKKMNLETAEAFINYILSNEISRKEAVIIEFIGGEPFIEVELIDQITDMFKLATYERNNEWFWNYRISICTNGVNYADPAVQHYIEKNRKKISLSITVDGTREKHDLQRVFPDGTGSFDTIDNNLALWLSQFPGCTKVTFSSEDLKYLKDSIISLWDKGITDVSANVVFEDVWAEGDEVVFEQQLMALADYVLDNALYEQYYCTLFDDGIGGYYTEGDKEMTHCGAGKMIALGPDGKLYPCLRYKGFSLNNHAEWCVGDVEKGIDMEKIRPFITAANRLQSDSECLKCVYAKGCAHCQGFNYDVAETPTNFYRAKYICKMQKSRVYANEYYFDKLYNMYGIERENRPDNNREMNFLLSDGYTSFCEHENTHDCTVTMDHDTIAQGLEYARRHLLKPVFIHDKNRLNERTLRDFPDYRIHHIISAKFHEHAAALRDYKLVYTPEDLDIPAEGIHCIFNTSAQDIAHLSENMIKLLGSAADVTVNIHGLKSDFDEYAYLQQLAIVKDAMVDWERNGGIRHEINVINQLCNLERSSRCNAGIDRFAYAPDGKLYICSADYSRGYEAVGDCIQGVVVKNAHLLSKEYSPICDVCDAHQCNHCMQTNRDATQEVNVAPSYKCRKSHIEREISRQYQQETPRRTTHSIPEIDYVDPIEQYLKTGNRMSGLYKYRKEFKEVQK